MRGGVLAIGIVAGLVLGVGAMLWLRSEGRLGPLLGEPEPGEPEGPQVDDLVSQEPAPVQISPREIATLRLAGVMPLLQFSPTFEPTFEGAP